ncbi:hypothetical protein QFZ21_002623 [Microbacterium sp. W4I20]|nr:hypothetical protein [Microbacterium sp. W4I20]
MAEWSLAFRLRTLDSVLARGLPIETRPNPERRGTNYLAISAP